MFARRRLAALFFALAAVLVGWSAGAEAQQRRIGLVVGISSYPDGTLATPVNDAALVAEALGSAGFELVQGADLDEPGLRRAVRDFLERARAAGPEAVAAVYFAGRAAQLEGDDFLIPAGARIDRPEDLPIVGIRVSDLVRSLGEGGGLRLLLLDAAHELPGAAGDTLAPGLAAVEAPKNWLVAQSTLPDLLLPETEGPYGPYAKAFVEMMRVPGLGLDEMFGKIRLRVHEDSGGVQVPWHDAAIEGVDFAFYDAEEPAVVRAVPRPAPARRVIADRPLRALGPEEAYSVVIERDDVPLYQDYLTLYPESPFAPRITALLVLRRESVIWRQSRRHDTREAYWTYLRRYPDGFHAYDARRRLARLSAPLIPPDRFDVIEYAGLPPPLAIVERSEPRVLVQNFYTLPPPPPPPVLLLPPRPREIAVLPPPPPASAPGALPVTTALQAPQWAKRRPPPPEPVVVRPVAVPRPAPPIEPRRAPVRALAPEARPQPDAGAPAPSAAAPRPQAAPQVAPTDDRNPARAAPAAGDRPAPRPGTAQDRAPDRPGAVEDRRPDAARPPALRTPDRDPETTGATRPADRLRPGVAPRPEGPPARTAPKPEEDRRDPLRNERGARPDRPDSPRATAPRPDAPRVVAPRLSPGRPEPSALPRPEPSRAAPARPRGPDPEVTGSRASPPPAQLRRPEPPRAATPAPEIRRPEPSRAAPPPAAAPRPAPVVTAPRPEPPRAAPARPEPPKPPPAAAKSRQPGDRPCGVPGKPPCS